MNSGYQAANLVSNTHIVTLTSVARPYISTSTAQFDAVTALDRHKDPLSPPVDKPSSDNKDFDLPPFIPISDNKDNEEFDPSFSDPLSSDLDNTPSESESDPGIIDSSSSSLDSDHSPVHIPVLKSSTMSSIAVLEQSSLTSAHILHPSIYTIDIFNEFHKVFEVFYLYKKVTINAHVVMALTALCGLAMKSWICLISVSMTDPITNWM